MKETVKSLVQKVAAGEIEAAAAGAQIRAVLSTVKTPTTEAGLRERYNDSGYETDPNSFVYVIAAKVMGTISKAQYAAIYKAVTG